MAVDWQVAEDTVVRPDNLVVCGHDITGTRLTVPPVLVFEILSPSTSRQDKILKYKLYEKAGVKYYCIVDPESTAADLFEFRSNKYGKTGDFRNGKMTLDLNCCRIDFDFNELFES
jgi:Uma2 family endonuclease